jgi:hypothetical protein
MRLRLSVHGPFATGSGDEEEENEGEDPSAAETLPDDGPVSAGMAAMTRVMAFPLECHTCLLSVEDRKEYCVDTPEELRFWDLL